MSLFFSRVPECQASTTTLSTTTAATITTTPTSLTVAAAVLDSTTTTRTNEPMDLSTPHRFNKRCREKSPPNENLKFAKKM